MALQSIRYTVSNYKILVTECEKCGGRIRLVSPLDQDYCVTREIPNPNGDHILKHFTCPDGHVKDVYYWKRENRILKTGS